MKTLYIVRHAKSDWGDEFLKDIDRHLNATGYRDAYEMSTHFFKENKTPDVLLSSSAIRALSTALIFARNLNYKENKIVIAPAIYEANTLQLLEVIYTIENEHQSAMLFGHNPGLTELFNTISNQFIDNLPTCGILALKFEVNKWEEIKHHKGVTLFTIFPKEFNH